MVLPFFKSHYSIGRSILTLEKPEKQIKNGPKSIIDICQKHSLKDFYLVEDSMGSFLEAYQNTKDLDFSFKFGLRINICENKVKSDDPTENAKVKDGTSKIIVFAKNKEGYYKLIKLYSDAACNGLYNLEPRTDYDFLKSIWNDDEMYLAIPFYDSFIFNNVIMGNNCIPSFSFTKPIMLLEENELFFDSIVRKRVLNYAESNKLETQEVKSIYYDCEDDYSSYLTFRCINKKNATIAKPNLEHCSSERFCFESWCKVSGTGYKKTEECVPEIKTGEEDE